MTMTTALAKTNGDSGLSIYAPDAIQATMTMAKALVASRLTPRGVDSPEKAFFIIMKGRELGVPPIRSLERIHVIEGRTCMAAELMLERFRGRGGRSKWLDKPEDRTRAELWLKAPNGDEHTELFTWEDAKNAGLAGKDNWRKWPKPMLRARTISQGLRALGEAEGMYDPDELGAVTNEEGEVIELPKGAVGVVAVPPKAPAPASTPAPPATSGAAALVLSTASTTPAPVAATPVMSSSPVPSDDDDADTEPVTDLVDCWYFKRLNPGLKNDNRGEWIKQTEQEPKRTLKQNDRIHALRTEIGIEEDEWRQKLGHYFAKTTSADLSRREASQLIKMLETRLKTHGNADAKKERAEAKAQRQQMKLARGLDTEAVGIPTERIPGEDDEVLESKP
jgi:hypothetical protein